MTSKLTFEEAMEQLEEIVKQLEDEDLPLEKAISYYEQGMKLSKLCNDLLEDAEKKVTLLVEENNEKKPFAGEES
ncbi:MAG TPA: exodeoxyribonuclease VII small subunit [Pseudogracilibacillus sp.]|nr:exodeoxyribonuclease VII small subunit [Pseudogracilibacillus sp.]